MTNDQRPIRPPPRRITAIPRPPAPVDETGALSFDAAPPLAPPATVEEAAWRFYARYGHDLVRVLLGGEVGEPQTVEDWIALARAVKAVQDAQAAGRQAVGEY